MEIIDAEAIPVEAPVAPLEAGGLAPYVGMFSSVTAVERVLVRLEADDGTEGWGEIRPVPSVDATVATLEADVFPEVVGRTVGEIRPFLAAFQYEYVQLDPYIAAVEMAMWDLHGRALGVPLSQLLGGRVEDTVPIAAPLGILDEATARAEAEAIADDGYAVLKTKGGRDWQADVERIIAMDEAADGKLEFRLDPNQGYTVEEAVRVASMLEDAGVYLEYFEQPVRVDSVGTYKRLRTRLRTPIGVNEDTYFRGNLFGLVREDAIDVAVVDIVPSGGILRCREQVAVAAEAGLSVAHHDAFDLGVKKAAVLQTVASTPAINLATDTVYPAWADRLLETPLAVAAGEMAVPDGPGLGIQVDRARVEALRIDT